MRIDRLWRSLPAWTFLFAGLRRRSPAGLRELGPHLIGFDPRELSKLNHRMDMALKGHPYVKSGIDIACWDILGKFSKLPVCVLMGGRFGESVRLYRAISQQAPDEMARNVAGYREQGYTRFQLKVGGDPIKISSAFIKPERLFSQTMFSWPMPIRVGLNMPLCESSALSETSTSISSSPV